jgi:outer membrane receptor protein involved in Fe transport
MSRILFVFLTCFLSFTIFSQTDKIGDAKNGLFKGVIQDSSLKIPLEYVAVRLFSSIDSTVVSGIYTSNNGKFEMTDVPYGTYYAKFTLSGYQTRVLSNLIVSKQDNMIDVGIFFLRLDPTLNLQEVKVTGKLDMLKIGIDKKVYNVGEDLSVKGGSVNDALNNIPSIQVDNDGNVSLRGDANVTILIDGRPSNLTGGSSKSLLESIPASSIERVEVVTNPSAKYDPDGTSGIINVVLKKNKLMGFNGYLSATGATGPFYNANASLSYRNKKVNTFLNYSRNYSTGYRNYYGTIRQSYSDGTVSRLEQNRDGTDLDMGHTATAGTDYVLTDRQTVGFTVTGALGDRTRKGDLMNEIYNENDTLVRSYERITDDPTRNKNIDGNINYKLDFKEDKGNLQVNFSQSNGWETNTGTYTENYFNLDGSQSSEPSLVQKSESEIDNLIRTGQVDYKRIFKNWNAYVEGGIKGIYRDQNVQSLYIAPDTTGGKENRSTHHDVLFDYHEDNYSSYGIFGHQLGKFKYQVGFRMESFSQDINQKATVTNYQGESASQNDTTEQGGIFQNKENRVRNNYFNFYPSGHLKYNPTDKIEFSFGYSRRINRPSPRQVSPFSNFADPYNLRVGNPDLKPEYINSLDFGYAVAIKNINLTANVYYRQTSNVIQRVKVFYADNTSAVTYANIDNSNDLGVEVVAVYKPTKWFRNTFSANGNYIQYSDKSSAIDFNRAGMNWSMKYVASFDSWKNTLTTQLNAQYSAPRVTAQGKIQPRASIDISTEKKLKEGKWTVGMRVSDIFNTKGFIFSIDQPSIYQSSEYKWLTRRFYLTVSYRFGKFTSSDKQKGMSDGGGGDF